MFDFVDNSMVTQMGNFEVSQKQQSQVFFKRSIDYYSAEHGHQRPQSNLMAS
jgi:hypothetical protein